MDIKHEDVINYLKENPNTLNEIMNDSHVEVYLATEQGAKFMQPKLDRYFNKGLETWKTNNLESLINDEVTKRIPNETPEQKRIRELEQKLEAQQKEVLKKEMYNKATQFAGEFKLPTQLAGYFVGDTEEATRDNISRFNDVFTSHLNAIVTEKTKGTTISIPANDNLINDNMTLSQFMAMKNKI